MKRSTRTLIPLAIALTLLATACGDDEPATTRSTSDPVATTTTTVVPLSEFTTTLATEAPVFGPVDYEGFRAQPTACNDEAPEPIVVQTYDAPDDMQIDPTTALTATITTSCGDIVVLLDPSVASETVNSFVFLAEQGYFDGGASHRIAPGYLMQAGDPTATGRGGPGYAIPDELPPADFLYEKGTLAMANAGPDTGGSQFFIMLDDVALPPAYTAFGHVIEGAEILDLIATVPLGFSGSGEPSSPLESVYLVRVTVDGPG